MVAKNECNSWANFDALVETIDNRHATTTGISSRSSRSRRTTTGDAASRWMTAPIDSEDLLPLAPPGVIESPRQGSAASRTRLSMDLSVKSARRPESISSFSRKKKHAQNEMETSTRTKSTSTADSTSESEKDPAGEKTKSSTITTMDAPRIQEYSTSDEEARQPFFDSRVITLDQREGSQPTSPRPVFKTYPSVSNSIDREGPAESKNFNGNTGASTRRGRSDTRDNEKSSRNAKVSSVRRSTTTKSSYDTKPRGRSTSRVRVPPPVDVVQIRERSSSQPRVRTTPRGSDAPQRRSSSRTRYPPPTTPGSVHRHRSRSASLSRISNEGRVTSMHSGSPSKRSHRRPPSTFHTRQELREASFHGGRSALSDGDAASVRSFGGWHSELEPGSSSEGNRAVASPLLEKSIKKTGLREKLFGDQVDVPLENKVSGVLGGEIRPRVLLAATVYHNTATNLWIATINTNQRGVAKNPTKANKYLKAFSFATEQEARESAIANAPPKMIPFNESPVCFICKGKFAVFRRACHCRNCGVCVCSSCSVSWSAKMIPDTYNLKNETQIKVCRSCNSLSLSFKKALLNGEWNEMLALYRTGNVNLRTPFPTPNKKDETMYPVHCAAEGGNMTILRWLIDERFCPVKVTMAAKRGTPAQKCPLRSSRGRSVLTIALESVRVDMLRYLVIDHGNSIYECKDLYPTLAALEATLAALPRDLEAEQSPTEIPLDIPSGIARWDNATFDDNCSEPSSLGNDEEGKQVQDDTKSRASSGRNGGDKDAGQICIICFDRRINCVGTPCGHAVCCLECTANLELCPVCNERSNFIKIFRP
jgi:FYVE zinc finger/Zinc finger, C3HC4 type (RING finger)